MGAASERLVSEGGALDDRLSIDQMLAPMGQCGHRCLSGWRECHCRSRCMKGGLALIPSYTIERTALLNRVFPYNSADGVRSRSASARMHALARVRGLPLFG
jgi:hypothetical protein